MRTPPANLPVVPEGWVYIGAENEIDVTGCEDDLLIGNLAGGKWLGNISPANRWTQNWGTSSASPHWHYIAKAGSKIARLNGSVEPTHKPLLVSVEKYAALQMENEHLTRENERLKKQIESRNQIIVGFKDSINRVMDF